MKNPSSSAPYIGRPLPRFEDRRLLRGAGRYTDDFSLEGEVWAAFVRSPFAAARINAIDTTEARALPGVLAVLTGQDYLAQGGQPMHHIPEPADARDHTKRAFSGYGHSVIDVPHLPMPVDQAQYLGEPLVMVVARNQSIALDACELVDLNLEELPFVIDAAEALAAGAPVVDPAIPGNLAVAAAFGDREAVETAFENAAHVVEGRFPNQRIVNAQMEPRSAIVTYDRESARFHMIAGSQGANRQRDTLAACLGVPPADVRVTCPDTGGGFGPRTNLSPEQPMLAIAARLLGRPVRWTSTRSEAFLSDYQGRDMAVAARMALDTEGRIMAYDAKITGNVGGRTVGFISMGNAFRVLTTVYHVPHAHVAIEGVMTNTTPTAPYRGAGRPEAHLAIESLLDRAARALALDRDEIRRRNIVRPEQMPYHSPMGLDYDSGDFSGNMERALTGADWSGFEDRRAAARARGKLAGIGIANYVESPVGMPHERIDLTVNPEGTVEVITGTQSTGQGHQTSFAQVMADCLGVTPQDIRLIAGDTARVISGGGSHSDRSMRLAGTLMREASDSVIAQAREVLAHLFGLPAERVAFTDGLFDPGQGNRRLSVFEVAAMCDDPSLPDALRKPLAATATFTGRMPAHPTGAAVCEVEIDPETGELEITRYTTVDDVGQPINPLILDGQTHGGIVQGLGQALSEAMRSDPTTGQVLSGAFMDYAMMRASDVPFFGVDLVEDPTSSNPLRIKGGGESGITPALAVTMNAVLDALAPEGVTELEMPASPGRIWQAIQDARQSLKEQTQ